jgi:hypothetical protein
MIESVMYIGIGFLAAGLLVIGVIPLVHGRAVRLTVRRLDALNPVSMAEIGAQKDQLRAEFAISTRRLEMRFEQLKTRSANHLAEIDKKNAAINRLKFELGEKAAVLALKNGPMGPAGPTGATGPQGPVGAQGPVAGSAELCGAMHLPRHELPGPFIFGRRVHGAGITHRTDTEGPAALHAVCVRFV